MPIPNRKTLKAQLLELLRGTGAQSPGQVYKYFAKKWHLTRGEQQERRSGGQTFKNKIRWARQELANERLILPTPDAGRGVWQLAPTQMSRKSSQPARSNRHPTINDFFQKALGANLTNARWSWGAVRPDSNRVFLRVWEDEIEQVREGKAVYLFNTKWSGSQRNGGKERAKHIDQLRGGAEGFGVVCLPRFEKTGERHIASYDAQKLLKLGDLIEMEGKVFARIVDHVDVGELVQPKTSASTLAPDLRSILSSNEAQTTKQTLIDARIGQGQFRASVLKLWEEECCVLGCRASEVLRASHIKPWRESSNVERLDPFNGLPLVATLDALFDSGLISFLGDGQVLVSTRLTEADQELLGLNNLSLRKEPPAETAKYLDWHKTNRFLP
jgi:putative restriction endonuclease